MYLLVTVLNAGSNPAVAARIVNAGPVCKSLLCLSKLETFAIVGIPKLPGQRPGCNDLPAPIRRRFNVRGAGVHFLGVLAVWVIVVHGVLFCCVCPGDQLVHLVVGVRLEDDAATVLLVMEFAAAQLAGFLERNLVQRT